MVKGFVLGLALVAGLASGVAAQTVPTEMAKLGGQKITLYVYPFLTENELTTLRLVQHNKQALAVFVPGTEGFAALAIAPNEGFLRDGSPVPSAVALSGLPDATSAAVAVLKGCDAARKGGEPCVIVLEIGPGK
ncbi:MAG: hypothetical protein ABIV25_15465 [Paracoccaceae bacterium]